MIVTLETTRLAFSYQTLINMYLRDCALQKRKLTLSWGR